MKRILVLAFTLLIASFAGAHEGPCIGSACNAGGGGGGGGVTSYTSAQAAALWGETCDAADNGGVSFYFGLTDASASDDCTIPLGTGAVGAVCYCDVTNPAHAFAPGGTAFMGPQGPIGPQGLTGDAGDIGPQGPQGDPGDDGAIAQIEDEGIPLTVFGHLNFEGVGVACADDSGKTTCSIDSAILGNTDPAVSADYRIGVDTDGGGAPWSEQFLRFFGTDEYRVVAINENYIAGSAGFDWVPMRLSASGIWFPQSVSTTGSSGAIVRGDAGGKIDASWLPDTVAMDEDLLPARWDVVIDVATSVTRGYASPCAEFVEKMEPFMTFPNSYQPHVYITGEATLTPSSFIRVRMLDGDGAGSPKDGPFDACFHWIPTAGYDDTVSPPRPVADPTEVAAWRARVHYENVKLTIDCTVDPTRWLVVSMEGASYLTGPNGGNFSSGPVPTGSLSVQTSGDCRPEASPLAGAAPAFDTAANGFLKTTDVNSTAAAGVIARFINGNNRHAGHNFFLRTETANNQDIIGILSFQTWGSVYNIKASGNWAGVWFMGSNSNLLGPPSYLTTNAIGVLIGDPRGGQVTAYHYDGDNDCPGGGTTCDGVFDTQGTNGIRIEAGNIETNYAGNIVNFAGGNFTVENVDLETGNNVMASHGVHLGAGICSNGSSAKQNQIAARDSECGDGTVAAPTSVGYWTATFANIEISGLNDTAATGLSAIALGPGAVAGTVKWSSHLSWSDTDGSGGEDAAVAFHPSAGVEFDLTGAKVSQPSLLLGAYPGFVHARERWLHFAANESTGWTTGECLPPLPGTSVTGLACAGVGASHPFARKVGTPGEQNWWIQKAHMIGLGTLAGQDCDFQLYDATHVLISNGNALGSPITVTGYTAGARTAYPIGVIYSQAENRGTMRLAASDGGGAGSCAGVQAQWEFQLIPIGIHTP